MKRMHNRKGWSVQTHLKKNPMCMYDDRKEREVQQTAWNHVQKTPHIQPRQGEDPVREKEQYCSKIYVINLITQKCCEPL